MIWPRAAALAELGWTPAPQRSWASFAARLPAEFARYRRLGLRYDITPLEPLASFDMAGGRLTAALRVPAGLGTLRYTVNGTVPGPESLVYAAPLTLAPGTTLTAQAFAGAAPLGTVRRWEVGEDIVRTRNSAELSLCGEGTPLRLEDDGATAGARRVLWGNVVRPCWIWKNALLDRIAGLSAEVGQVPFTFSMGAKLAQVTFDKPETPAGELVVRLDSCTGAVIVRLPLAAAAGNAGLSRVTGAIPAQAGRHDLCVRFAQSGPDPLWMLDRLTLDPAR
jgi:hexosaminidase